MYMMKILLFLLLLQLSWCSKIKDRFKWDPATKKPLTTGIPKALIREIKKLTGKTPPLNDEGSLSVMIGYLPGTFTPLYKGINITTLLFDTTHLGFAQPDGNYSGVRGMVQRGELNFAPGPMRYDCAPFEPGYMLPYLTAGHSPRIYYSVLKLHSQHKLDITSFVVMFPPDFWKYFLVIIILVAFIFVLVDKALKRKKKRKIFYSEDKVVDFDEEVHVDAFHPSDLTLQIINLLVEFLKMWENYYLLMLDLAPTVIYKTRTASILWTFVVVSFFYGFHIVLLSLFSVDMVVPLKVPVMDSLEGLLYDPEFKHLKPMVLSNINMLGILHSSTNKDEQELYKKVINNKTGILMNITEGANLHTITTYMTKVTSGQAAFIEKSELINQWLLLGCYLRPDMLMKLHISKEVISPSASGILFSWDTDPDLLKLVEYRLLTMSETAFGIGLYQTYGTNIVKAILQGHENTKSNLCREKINGLHPVNTIEDKIEEDIMELQLPVIFRLLKICATMIFLGLLFLMFECFSEIIDQDFVEGWIKIFKFK